MAKKYAKGLARMDLHAAQALKLLKASRITARVLVAVGGVLLLASAYLMGASLLERQRAVGSADWPSAEGRILSSEIVSSSMARGVRDISETTYLATVIYAYRVDGKRHQGSRIRFTGDEGSGASSCITHSDAQEEAAQYPEGMAVPVYYDPGEPGEAVLEPGVVHYEAMQFHGPMSFLLLAFMLAVIVPLAIRQGARKAVSWLAEMSPVSVWEVAAEYGILPPPGTKGLGQEPVPEWSVQARQTLRLNRGEVTFEIGPCLVHTEGDLAGNLDLPVRITPMPPLQVVTDNLRLRLPDSDMTLGVLATGETTQGLEVIFSLSDIASELALEQRASDDGATFDFDGWQRQATATLTAIQVIWGTESPAELGTVPCLHDGRA